LDAFDKGLDIHKTTAAASEVLMRRFALVY